jgi:hypothetical protein
MLKAGKIWSIKPKMCVFNLSFNGNAIIMGTNITNLGHKHSNNIFWLAIISEMCIPIIYGVKNSFKKMFLHSVSRI